MKKLMLMSVVALVAANSGCCRTWSSWWNRGAACDTCTPVTTYDCDPVQTYSGGAVMVAPGTIMPGPVLEALPPGQ